MIDVFECRCNSKHRIARFGADALAQDNDVIHTLTPDRPDQPFDNAIHAVSLMLRTADAH
jgi:hypothetical protein